VSIHRGLVGEVDEGRDNYEFIKREWKEKVVWTIDEINKTNNNPFIVMTKMFVNIILSMIVLYLIYTSKVSE
jgi:hypothetical protein